MNIYYDKEGDYLEILFGEPTQSYFEKVGGKDIFVRIDEKTKKVRGYSITSFMKKISKNGEIEINPNERVSNKGEKLKLIDKMLSKSRMTEKDADIIGHKIKKEIAKRFKV